MPHFLTDLAVLQVRTDEFLETVLDATAQPIWVVDPDDVIRLANPAAVAALGYDDAAELLGRPSHQTIHYRHPDGTRFPASDCPMRLPRVTGETVVRDLDWFIRRDGSMIPVSYVAAPDRDAGRPRRRHRLHGHRRPPARRRNPARARRGAADARALAAAYRVAGGRRGRVVRGVRGDRQGGRSRDRLADGRPVALRGRRDGNRPRRLERASTSVPGRHRWPLDGPTICAKVLETGRTARIEDFAAVPGTIADAARGTRIRACAGAPIIVDGAVWGAMSADAIEPLPLPDGIEARLAEFTELVATAVASSASREQLATLAEEQAALRRVATLVARESPPAEIFAAVAEEVGRLLRVEDTTIFRYEDDGTAMVVADRGDRPVPSRSAA